MRKSNELQIGKAGEYLACADLIMMGLIAFPSEQGLPYDILIDTGIKLLRCQVKTTRRPRKVSQRAKDSFAYIFNVKKHGKLGKARYSADEVDLFALVELEERSVVYLTTDRMPDTINIRVDRLRGTHRDEMGAALYAEITSPKYKGMTHTRIAKEVGSHVSLVNRMLQPGFTPFETSALYWSDLKRTREWFDAI